MGQPRSAFQLGIDLGHASRGSAPRKAHAEAREIPLDEHNVTEHPHRTRHENAEATSRGALDANFDHFVRRNGRVYAGGHLIVDLWDAHHLDDLDHVDRTLREAAEAAGATLLHIHLHHFTPNNGVSGVAVLAESHISIHTWPEHGFAALDIFMCGDAEPDRAIPVLRRAFEPATMQVDTLLRGDTALALGRLRGKAA